VADVCSKQPYGLRIKDERASKMLSKGFVNREILKTGLPTIV